MNKFIASISLSLCVPAFVCSGYEGQSFTLVPYNFIHIETYTSFDQKTKHWDWEPNEHFVLASYKTHKSSEDSKNYMQSWLFQVADKPGQTELVFTHKKKKKVFPVKILKRIPNPNQMTAAQGLFDSNQ